MASLLLVAVGLQQISERLRQSRGLVHQARGLGDRGGHGTDPECADLAFVDRELAAALPDERVDATPVLEHGSKMVVAVTTRPAVRSRRPASSIAAVKSPRDSASPTSTRLPSA